MVPVASRYRYLRWFALLLGLLIALSVQINIRQFSDALRPVFLYGIAVILFLYGAPPPAEDRHASRESPVTSGHEQPSILGRWLSTIGLAATGWATWILWQDLSNPAGLALWLCGLASFLIAFHLSSVQTESETTAVSAVAKSPKWIEPALLLLLTVCALVVRFWDIDIYPSGLQSDEGNNGVEALKWLSGMPYSPYSEANEGQASLFTYLIALNLRIFGNSVVAMRATPVFAATATIVAFYFLVRRLYGPSMGLVGTGLLVFSRWHMTFSRIVYELILVPLAAIWLFHFLYQGLQDGRRRNFVLAGYALAFGLNTYTAFRVMPAGIVILAAYWILMYPKRLQSTIRGLILFSLSAAMGLVPLAIYAIKHPDIVMVRTAKLSILQDIMAAGDLGPARHNIRSYLLMFNWHGDPSPLNNLPDAPMLDAVMGAMLVLGLAYALRYWKTPQLFLALAWIAAVLPAGLFSVTLESPSSRRVIGLVPVIYLLATALLDVFRRASLQAWPSHGRPIWLAGVGGVVTAVAILNTTAFFTVQAVHPAVWRAFSPTPSTIARYIASLGRADQIYLAPDYNNHSAIRFIAKDPEYTVLDLNEQLPLRKPLSRDVVFIVAPSARQLEDVFLYFYPNGRWQVHTDPFGEPLFYSFTVTPAQQAFYTIEAPVFGLMGAYYDNASWEGEPHLLRHDLVIASNESLASPYSVIWRGSLWIEQAGRYRIGTNSDDGSLVFLDGQLIVDNGGSHGARYVEGQVDLETGLHPLEVHYFQDGGSQTMKLFWTPPNGKRAEIPPKNLLVKDTGSLVPSTLIGQVSDGMISPPNPIDFVPAARAGDGVSHIVLSSLVAPRGVAAGPSGHIYITDVGAHMLIILSPDGEIVSRARCGSEPFQEPSDVAVGPGGLVYVLDAELARICVFGPDGRYLRDIRGQERYLGRARGIDVDSEARIWVASTPNGRVVALDPSGKIEVDFPMAPEKDSQPVDVVVAHEGDIFVTDVGSNQLLRLSPSGDRLNSWTIPTANSVDGPHLATDGENNLYLTSPEEGIFMKVIDDGRAEEWPLSQNTEEIRMKPVGIAVGEDGLVWIVDGDGGRLVTSNTTGK